MSIKFSKRIQRAQPSATMAVNAKAKALMADGIDIINLSVGEPDFDTPELVRQAGIDAINNGFTRYTDTGGIPELKEAILHKFKTDNDLIFKSSEVMASDGVKQVLYNLCQVLLDEGDEVIIPTPYWVSYPAMVELADAKPVFIETTLASQFKITPEQLKSAINSETRMFMLNSPSNPSGMAYTLDELKALGKVLSHYPNVIIVTDDIYEYILWGHDKFVTFLNACPELRDRTVTLNGLSKAHAMTGWRLGYAAAPESIIKAMLKIQSQSTSCPCSITQYAAVTALNMDRSFFTPMLDAYKRRHDLVYNALSNMNGVDCRPSDGTFYLFPDATKAIQHHGLKDDIEFASFILEKAHVALVPGTAFGSPNHIRISCATSDDNLEKAIEQLTSHFMIQ